MGFDVIGGLDQEVGIDDRDERFGCQVSGLFPGECLEVGLDLVVLVVLRPDVSVDRGCFLHKV